MNDENNFKDQKGGASLGYENRDVNVFRIALIVAAVLVIGGVCMIAANYYMRLVTRQPNAGPAYQPESFPQPQLQEIPASDLARLRERYETELTTYGWVNRSGGIVRIPIERAMELLIQRGLPQTKVGVTQLEMQQQKAMKPKEVPGEG